MSQKMTNNQPNQSERQTGIPAARASSAQELTFQPWQRRADESEEAYEAAHMYFTWGAARSVYKVAKKLGKDPSLMRRWSSRHEWKARVTNYDQSRPDVLRAALDDSIRKQAEYWREKDEQSRQQVYRGTTQMTARAEEMFASPVATVITKRRIGADGAIEIRTVRKSNMTFDMALRMMKQGLAMQRETNHASRAAAQARFSIDLEHAVSRRAGPARDISGAFPAGASRSAEEAIPRAWERLPGESARAYEAAHLYFAMGPDRTLEAVARKLDKDLSLMKRWSRWHQWKARAADYTQTHEDLLMASINDAAGEQAALWRTRDEELWKRMSQLAEAEITRANEIITVWPLSSVTTKYEHADGTVEYITVLAPGWTFLTAARMAEFSFALAEQSIREGRAAAARELAELLSRTGRVMM